MDLYMDTQAEREYRRNRLLERASGGGDMHAPHAPSTSGHEGSRKRGLERDEEDEYVEDLFGGKRRRDEVERNGEAEAKKRDEQRKYAVMPCALHCCCLFPP